MIQNQTKGERARYKIVRFQFGTNLPSYEIWENIDGKLARNLPDEYPSKKEAQSAIDKLTKVPVPSLGYAKDGQWKGTLAEMIVSEQNPPNQPLLDALEALHTIAQQAYWQVLPEHCGHDVEQEVCQICSRWLVCQSNARFTEAIQKLRGEGDA